MNPRAEPALESGRELAARLEPLERVERGSRFEPFVVLPVDLATGWLGAFYLIPLELFALGRRGLDGMPVAVAMLVGLALLVGVVIALGEASARVLPWSSARAVARSFGSLIVTIPVGRHLFDGGFASTLPGAAWAPLWFPALGLLALAAVLWIGERMIETTRGKMVLGVVLLLSAFLTDWVNRHVKRNEHDDLHTMLLCIECVAFGVGLRAVVRDVHFSTRVQWRATAASLLAGCLVLASALGVGLHRADARKALAGEGMHGRLLVRTVRGVFDRDDDGYSTVLAGGDCDDGDAAVHPGAIEQDGNDIDEDCDGSTELDPAMVAAREAAAAHEAALRSFEVGQSVTDLVARTRGYNVVLIAIDTLRADVLQGPDAARAFPRFHQLLSESRWFHRAYAPAAGTDLSMGGLLTGLIDPYTPKAKTMAMVAQETSHLTHAVIPREVLRYVGRELLTRGLDGRDRLLNDTEERDVGSYTTSSRTTELGLAFVDEWQQAGKSKPFWLWLHYFDVHEHHEVKLTDRHIRERIEGIDRELTPLERYRLLVSIVDEQIGAVMDALRERGLLDTTIIVLVSDHGEGLGEAARLPDNHGRVVYDPLVRVPLAIRIPGVTPQVIEAPVSLLDVYPTLVQLMGATPPRNDGVSLLAHLVEGAPVELTQRVRPLPLNESDQYGVVLWPYKLIVHRQGDAAELYDLAADPDEGDDLSEREPQRVRMLRSTYATLPHVEVDRSEKGRRARESRSAGE